MPGCAWFHERKCVPKIPHATWNSGNTIWLISEIILGLIIKPIHPIPERGVSAWLTWPIFPAYFSEFPMEVTTVLSQIADTSLETQETWKMWKEPVLRYGFVVLVLSVLAMCTKGSPSGTYKFKRKGCTVTSNIIPGACVSPRTVWWCPTLQLVPVALFFAMPPDSAMCMVQENSERIRLGSTSCVSRP